MTNKLATLLAGDVGGDETPATLRRDSLEHLLAACLMYGSPRLTYISGGWVAFVDMNTPAPGTKFEVRSEFGMPSPLAAVQQCFDRVVATVRK